MKIVVLDGQTLNPGDLSWVELEKLGSCTVYERTAPTQVLERAGDAEVVLTNKTVLGRGEIAGLRRLRYIGLLATGYNVVDVVAAKERGIVVTNIPTYGTSSVAQMAFALLLELCHHVGEHARSVREGDWTRSNDFCFWNYPLVELQGLTFGVIGYGRIGATVAALARAFGMQVIGYTVPASSDSGVEWVMLDDVFRRSDAISLHCPLTPETKGIVDARRLALMKPTAFLLNTSRGPLVDECALAEALNRGALAGAGIDVLPVEPPPADNPLLSAKNCLITPHIAWATLAARARLMETAVENVRAFQAGNPIHTVT